MKVALFCELSVRPEHFDEFMPLMRQHATTCQREEDGCTIFHVGRDRRDPFLIRIYEQYEQQSDVDLHNSTDRFASFNAEIDHMLSNVVVHTVDLPW